MVALLLALFAASDPAPAGRDILPSAVSESLTRALAVAGARIVPLSWSAPAGCRVRNASVAHALDGSGRVSVKISGPGCSGWGWAVVEVWAQAAVTTRAVRAGEALNALVAVIEHEVRPGHMPYLPPDGAVAIRSLSAGTVVNPADVGGSTVVAGDPVKILVVSGVLAVEAQGRRIPCGQSRACAVLSSGKHLEGHMDDNGRLIVEVP
jgi:flagella basal body P-ring formation protein FlgA